MAHPQWALDLTHAAELRIADLQQTATASVLGLYALGDLQVGKSRTVPGVSDKDLRKWVKIARDNRDLWSPRQYSFGLIALTSILEAFVLDLVAGVLEHSPNVRNEPAVQKLEVPYVQFVDTPQPRQWLMVAELLNDRLPRGRAGVERQEFLMEAVGVKGPLAATHRRHLVEMSEVRNAIAHRRAIADRVFVERCGWLGLKTGDPIEVTPDSFMRYLKSAQDYVRILYERVENAI